MPDATALAGKHQVRPLPFQPARLKGLSERLIVSHHENNYGGAVRNLTRVEEELSRVTEDTPPPIVAALKERELTFANSATLHELYFGNLGGDGRPGGPVADAVARASGSFPRWEELFRLTSMGHAGVRLRAAATAARHVRALVRARLRRGGTQVRRRLFPEHQLG